VGDLADAMLRREICRLTLDQRWCSVVRGTIVLTPNGRFLSTASAARYHNVAPAGWPGWWYAEPYQIPVGALASPPRRPRERRTPENEEQP
jgi:hypothetical protein